MDEMQRSAVLKAGNTMYKHWVTIVKAAGILEIYLNTMATYICTAHMLNSTLCCNKLTKLKAI